MNIDITPIDNRNIKIEEFLKFTQKELTKHRSKLEDTDYKKIAFTPSNHNNYKVFFEEIVPLMYFLQVEKDIYKKIKYTAGNQKGEAILDESTVIEATKAQHSKHHMQVQDVLTHGHAFSSKKIIKNSHTIPTQTQPYSYESNEHVDDLFSFIIKAIKDKQKKDYPKNSILIVLFECDTLMVESYGEYTYLENKLKTINKSEHFSKIFIVENFSVDTFQAKWSYIL